MAKQKKRSDDVNVIASQIAGEATEEESTSKLTEEKNPHAVALGRLGGLKGGKARAKKLSPERRKEISRKAAEKRWSKKGDK